MGSIPGKKKKRPPAEVNDKSKHDKSEHEGSEHDKSEHEGSEEISSFPVMKIVNQESESSDTTTTDSDDSELDDFMVHIGEPDYVALNSVDWEKIKDFPNPGLQFGLRVVDGGVYNGTTVTIAFMSHYGSTMVPVIDVIKLNKVEAPGNRGASFVERKAARLVTKYTKAFLMEHGPLRGYISYRDPHSRRLIGEIYYHTKDGIGELSRHLVGSGLAKKRKDGKPQWTKEECRQIVDMLKILENY